MSLKEQNIEITKNIPDSAKDILNEDAIKFIVDIHNLFNHKRCELLKQRKVRQAEFNAGKLPNFLEETKDIREADWTVAPIPNDMKQRVVEITGPVDRKMIINALNSEADCFMADFEDSCSPTWSNILDGHLNLRDAVNKTIELKTNKKHYKLKDNTAKLLVRPRGWHLEEKHVLVNDEPISASIFDFCLFMFHNGPVLVDRNETPAFYLPKIESHLEARLWNEVIKTTQARLGIPLGTVRATVLIETLPAAFEMDEILWELKEHSAGLNAGRWDYIFSAIKTLGSNPKFIFPNRSEVKMTTHMMSSYSKLIIETCHRRGAHAMGGMSAYIPRKDDEGLNEKALEEVKKDKWLEVLNGHDGTWVAHPGLINIAKEQFKRGLEVNQIEFIPGYEISQDDMLSIPEGNITMNELRNNIRICLQYLSSWLSGLGCVPLNYLMEDLATAEISRAQLWQWLKHEVKIDNVQLDRFLLDKELGEQVTRLKEENYASSYIINLSKDILTEMVLSYTCPPFMSSVAYKYLE